MSGFDPNFGLKYKLPPKVRPFMRAKKPDSDQPNEISAPNPEGTKPKKGPSKAPKKNKLKMSGIIAVGLDNDDNQERITHSKHFMLLGGSEETHERMQDTAIRFEEKLKDRGKRLQDTSINEVLDLLMDSMR
ncbi:MAG: hypothetical protein NT142_07765 [Planctomycetota bacterium]|nr:hypothetical protein [Planctomycetota bacterium]